MIRALLAYFELVRMAVVGRYRRRSRYWAWRRETAFGGPRRLTRAQRARALRDVALWSRDMRRAAREPRQR